MISSVCSAIAAFSSHDLACASRTFARPGARATIERTSGANCPAGTFAALARQRLAGLAAKPPALDPARFDGAWSVTIECEPYNAAAGYRLQFPARVKDGVIDAQNGVVGEPSSLTMTGKIAADGNGSVAVRGLTGNPNATLNREARGSSYGYRANLRFEGSRGSGTRVEARPCTLTFVR